MTALRRLLLDHRTLALWLALAALTVKLLVPAGFMVGTVDGRVSLQICSGFGPVVAAPMMHHAMAGHADAGQAVPGRPDAAVEKAPGHDGAEHAGVEMPCPFAALAHGAVAAADAPLLASAIAFVLARGLVAVTWPLARRVAFLRPPLRGPPILS